MTKINKDTLNYFQNFFFIIIIANKTATHYIATIRIYNTHLFSYSFTNKSYII